MRVEVLPQVDEFVHGLAPEPRRRLISGLRGLESERGDICALQGELEGFYRLRVGGYRVVFRYKPGCVIECVYANSRGLVYEIFARQLAEYLGS